MSQGNTSQVSNVAKNYTNDLTFSNKSKGELGTITSIQSENEDGEDESALNRDSDMLQYR